MSQIVITHPESKPSFAQRKAIFGIGLSIGYSKAKVKALSAKPKTKGQASAIIQQLLKVQAKATSS